MGSDLGRIGRGLFTGGLSEIFYEPMKKQEEAQQRALEAQQKAEMDARRIAAEAKPLEESATLGVAEQAKPLDSLGLITEADLTKRKQNTGLGTAGTTGLGGTSLSSSLGLGV